MHPTTLSAFNARWLQPEEVARTFVPVPQFRQLTHTGHSLLLGPRGCGKTTLLKMLTRPALAQWFSLERQRKFSQSFSVPSFEAIYIPADVRWSYELASIEQETRLQGTLGPRAQRLMVNTNALIHALNATEFLTKEQRSSEAEISTRIIKKWQLKNTLNDFQDIRATLRDYASTARGYLSSADFNGLEKHIENVHPILTGHALDAPLEVIHVIEENLPAELCPKSWGLCFDELEIAPSWLRTELLESLRSATQNVFLKLTWSPLLPSGLKTTPESAADFKPIRLWHSHLTDPKNFCEDLTQEFIRERLGDDKLTPISFFSRSILAAEEEPAQAYEPGSTEYEIFKELAEWDASLRQLMEKRGIDPRDPKPTTIEQRDQFFRKIKPIALLRSEFRKPYKRRSRKSATLYAGLEAIYAMSEGNPRWLLGLLNDFVDVGLQGSELKNIKYSEQARILNNFSHRFLTQIKSSPFHAKEEKTETESTLYDFIARIGNYFRTHIRV